MHACGCFFHQLETGGGGVAGRYVRQRAELANAADHGHAREVSAGQEILRKPERAI